MPLLRWSPQAGCLQAPPAPIAPGAGESVEERACRGRRWTPLLRRRRRAVLIAGDVCGAARTVDCAWRRCTRSCRSLEVRTTPLPPGPWPGRGWGAAVAGPAWPGLGARHLLAGVVSAPTADSVPARARGARQAISPRRAVPLVHLLVGRAAPRCPRPLLRPQGWDRRGRVPVGPAPGLGAVRPCWANPVVAGDPGGPDDHSPRRRSGVVGDAALAGLRRWRRPLLLRRRSRGMRARAAHVGRGAFCTAAISPPILSQPSRWPDAPPVRWRGARGKVAATERRVRATQGRGSHAMAQLGDAAGVAVGFARWCARVGTFGRRACGRRRHCGGPRCCGGPRRSDRRSGTCDGQRYL